MDLKLSGLILLATYLFSSAIVFAQTIHGSGEWRGTYRCGSQLIEGKSPEGFTVKVSLAISNGEASLTRETQRVIETMRGKVSADGSVPPAGPGWRKDEPNVRWSDRFDGKFAGSEFKASGVIESTDGKRNLRDYTLALERVGNPTIAQAQLPASPQMQPKPQPQSERQPDAPVAPSAPPPDEDNAASKPSPQMSKFAALLAQRSADIDENRSIEKAKQVLKEYYDALLKRSPGGFLRCSDVMYGQGHFGRAASLMVEMSLRETVNDTLKTAFQEARSAFHRYCPTEVKRGDAFYSEIASALEPVRKERITERQRREIARSEIEKAQRQRREEEANTKMAQAKRDNEERARVSAANQREPNLTVRFFNTDTAYECDGPDGQTINRIFLSKGHYFEQWFPKGNLSTPSKATVGTWRVSEFPLKKSGAAPDGQSDRIHFKGEIQFFGKGNVTIKGSDRESEYVIPYSGSSDIFISFLESHKNLRERYMACQERRSASARMVKAAEEAIAEGAKALAHSDKEQKLAAEKSYADQATQFSAARTEAMNTLAEAEGIIFIARTKGARECDGYVSAAEFTLKAAYESFQGGENRARDGLGRATNTSLGASYLSVATSQYRLAERLGKNVIMASKTYPRCR